MTIDEMAHNFFEIRNQAHLWHWQTTSYAEHRALGGFYDKWLDLSDSFVETFAGKYRRPTGGMKCDALPYQEGMPYQYMVSIATFMASAEVRSIAPDTDLQNILDEMTALASATAYQLTLK